MSTDGNDFLMIDLLVEIQSNVLRRLITEYNIKLYHIYLPDFLDIFLLDSLSVALSVFRRSSPSPLEEIDPHVLHSWRTYSHPNYFVYTSTGFNAPNSTYRIRTKHWTSYPHHFQGHVTLC